VKLAAWSLLATGFFLFVGASTFPGGAFQFTDYAEVLVHGVQVTARYHQLYQRDVGYPLLILATGYAATHSFTGLVLLQATMAWSIPLLVYGTVGPAHHRAGFAAGLVTILSMSPFLFMKMIHHDQAYVFLSLLTVYLAACFVRSSQVRFLYLAIATMIFASLTRPAGNLLAVPLIVLIWLYRPTSWRHCLVGFAAMLACAAAYADHRAVLLGVTLDGTVPSYVGRQVFYNLYVNSAAYGVRIDPSVGPATAHLFAQVSTMLAQGSLHAAPLEAFYSAQNIPEAARKFWFTRFDGHDDEFVESLIEHPSYDYFEFFCQVEKSDRAFLLAALEIAEKHRWYGLRFTLRNLRLFLWSPGYAHGRYGLEFDTFGPQGVPFPPLEPELAVSQLEAFVQEPGRSELLKPAPPTVANIRQLIQPLAIVWKGRYRTGARILTALALIALLTLFRGPDELRAPTAIAWLCLFYNAVITSAFAEPSYRYHFMMLPILCTLGGVGVATLGYAMQRHVQFPAVIRTHRVGHNATSRRLHYWAAGAMGAVAVAVAIAWALSLRMPSASVHELGHAPDHNIEQRMPDR